MENQFFLWVAELNPWVWVALGITLITIEILAPSFIFVWPGLAAIVMAVIVWLVPGLAGEYLVAIFAILSLVMIFVGRKFVTKYTDKEPASRLNARSRNMVGQRAKVLAFEDGRGTIEVSGVQWPARWDNGEIANPGHTVVITEADGVTLRVTNA